MTGGRRDDRAAERAQEADRAHGLADLAHREHRERDARGERGDRGAGRAVQRDEYEVQHDVQDRDRDEDAGEARGPVAGGHRHRRHRVQPVEDGRQAEQPQRQDRVVVRGAVEHVDERVGEDDERQPDRQQDDRQRLERELVAAPQRRAAGLLHGQPRDHRRVERPRDEHRRLDEAHRGGVDPDLRRAGQHAEQGLVELQQHREDERVDPDRERRHDQRAPARRVDVQARAQDTPAELDCDRGQPDERAGEEHGRGGEQPAAQQQHADPGQRGGEALQDERDRDDLLAAERLQDRGPRMPDVLDRDADADEHERHDGLGPVAAERDDRHAERQQRRARGRAQRDGVRQVGVRGLAVARDLAGDELVEAEARRDDEHRRERQREHELAEPGLAQRAGHDDEERDRRHLRRRLADRSRQRVAGDRARAFHRVPSARAGTGRRGRTRGGG